MTELEPDTPVSQVKYNFCRGFVLLLEIEIIFLSAILPLQCDYDRLQLSTSSLMERNMEFLIECMDDLSIEQQKVCFTSFTYRFLSYN